MVAGILGYPPGYHDRKLLKLKNGGGRGIRTPGRIAPTAVFKTACFNRSHIPPRERTALLSLLYDNRMTTVRSEAAQLIYDSRRLRCCGAESD